MDGRDPIAQLTANGHTFRLHALEDCSVSQHLLTTGEWYERSFLDRLSALLPGGSTFVDVGAHVGNHTVFLSGVTGCDVIAFEPNPQAFERLVRNVDGNGLHDRVRCYNAAVSAEAGRAKLHGGATTDQGTYSLEATAVGNDDVVSEVQTVTLNAVTAEIDDATPILVKVDVEGHEHAVLQGAWTLITRPNLIGIAIECATVDAFDRVREALDGHLRPLWITNATPTILFVPVGGDELIDDVDAMRYAIRAAETSNSASARARAAEYRASAVPRLVAERDAARNERDAARASSVAVDRLLDAVIEIGADGGLSRLVDEVAGVRSAERAVRATQRVIVIHLGKRHPVAELLSILTDRVDEVRIQRNAPGCSVRMRSLVGGRRVDRASADYAFVDGPLVAAAVRNRLEMGGPLDLATTVCYVTGVEQFPALAQALIEVLGVDYAIAYDELRYSSHLLRLDNGALGCFVGSQQALSLWSQQHVVPAQVIPQPAELIDVFDRHLESPQVAGSLSPPIEADAMRVLLVSYFGPPTTPVSTRRLGYWHDEFAPLAKAAGVDLHVEWLTATMITDSGDRVWRVPDRGLAGLPVETRRRIAAADAVDVPTLGMSWSHWVRRALEASDRDYDVVIVSCGPFGYLDLAEYFAQEHATRVVLDFRDPFAGEARMAHSEEGRAAMLEFESAAVRHADLLVSVNDQCLSLIAPGSEIERLVVPNGFDERAYELGAGGGRPSTSDELPVRLVYTGTIFADAGLEAVLDALPASRYRLDHIGRDLSAIPTVGLHAVGRSLGFVADPGELAARLTSYDVGIVRTTGEPTTQTTKIFDYIGADLDIVIVTDGELRSGGLHDLTAELSGVFWVRNSEAELRSFFESYEPRRRRRSDADAYSRRTSAQRLLDWVFSSRGEEHV